MRRRWLVVVSVSLARAAFADPRFEVGGSMSLEHLSSGTCNGTVADPCPGAWGYSLALDAAELFVVSPSWSIAGRVLAGAGFSKGGVLARGYLGLGVRAQWSRWYVELTGGGETMFGDTGTGESGIASGASLAVSPRVGVHVGRAAFEIVGMVAPQASGQLGLADYDLGVLASHVIGD